jgi:hypothetical protein
MYVSGVPEGGKDDADHNLAKGSKCVSSHRLNLENATSSANPSG